MRTLLLTAHIVCGCDMFLCVLCISCSASIISLPLVLLFNLLDTASIDMSPPPPSLIISSSPKCTNSFLCNRNTVQLLPQIIYFRHFFSLSHYRGFVYIHSPLSFFRGPIFVQAILLVHLLSSPYTDTTVNIWIYLHTLL